MPRSNFHSKACHPGPIELAGAKIWGASTHVFFGLTWGARGPSITAKTADLFPGPQLGTILGAITMGTGVGSALGSWLAGFTFDVTGSYRVAFTLSIIFYACGSVAFWMLRRPAAGE